MIGIFSCDFQAVAHVISLRLMDDETLEILSEAKVAEKIRITLTGGLLKYFK